MNYDVIIPTRNSGSYIGVFLDAYRRLGIEPLYIVDTRSIDDTLAVLSSLGARIAQFEPAADFAEAGMIEYGAKAAAADWIWRIDDDEFPSKSLVDWIGEAEWATPVVGVCRRDVHFHKGYVYSRWPSRLHPDRIAVNYQYRIFRRDFVRYIRKVHTPGYQVPEDSINLPGDLYLIHLNCILHDVDFRLAKVRTYAQFDEEMSWAVVDECLPEYLDPRIQQYRSDGLDEFSHLFAALKPTRRPTSLPPLSHREIERVQALVVKARGIMKDEHDLANMRRLARAPRSLLRETSKLLSTISGPMRLPFARTWSEILWNAAHWSNPPEQTKLSRPSAVHEQKDAPPAGRE